MPFSALVPLSHADEATGTHLSDWWHQSITVVASHQTRFGPRLNSDAYLEYEAYARKDWLDFYGYIDIPRTFGIGNSNDSGIWDKGSPLFMEIEPRFSIDKITGLNLGSSLFKVWYVANNYIFDLGRNKASRQNAWYMGLGTDINTGSKLSLSANFYAKYQWENYGAGNENSWDGDRFKIKYFYPLTSLWGVSLTYIGFTNFDFGSDMPEQDGSSRTRNAIASSHILALNHAHWHYGFVARYFRHGGQWKDGTELDFGQGSFRTRTTGWGHYLLAGYSF